MSDREFVDTNILIYAFDRTAGGKQAIAAALVERLALERSGCLSLQVLQEFFVAATRKLAMPAADAARQVAHLGKWTLHRPGLDDVIAAIEIHRRKRVSFWDSLLLRSAMQLECSVLWSEDLNDGQRWNGLVLRNPFTGVER